MSEHCEWRHIPEKAPWLRVFKEMFIQPGCKEGKAWREYVDTMCSWTYCPHCGKTIRIVEGGE